MTQIVAFSETFTMYGGNWRRWSCRRRGHVLIVALAEALTLQGVCLQCHAAGDIEGIAPTFTRTTTPLTEQDDA